jgi:hypothetical protein
MLSTGQAESHWKPGSEEDRKLVYEELEAMLSSYHFRSSKRYPAFLRYIVDAALDGRAADLKERTLGIEVFGRDPEYDTSVDPVVRFSASEVRKRIAQYYHENGNGCRVQIELPLGSYVPEFSMRVPAPPGPLQIVEPLAPPSPLAEAKPKAHSAWIPSVLVALILVAGILIAVAYRRSQQRKAPAFISSALWGPLVQSPGQVLIVVGPVRQETTVPTPQNTGAIDSTTGRYDNVSVLSAVALAHLAGVLQQHGRPYEVKEATETSLADMRDRPLILIGAINNTWTMDIVSNLRYRFAYDGRFAKILDSRNPQSAPWSVDLAEPAPTVTTDYAIVARFHDPTTEGPVMVVAGLGPNGTETASEFVNSPQYMEQLAQKAPAGWEKKNLELVLRLQVIGSRAGPPAIIAANVW